MDDITKADDADKRDQAAAKHEALAKQASLPAEQARKGAMPGSQKQTPESQKMPAGTPDYGKWTATTICAPKIPEAKIIEKLLDDDKT